MLQMCTHYTVYTYSHTSNRCLHLQLIWTMNKQLCKIKISISYLRYAFEFRNGKVFGKILRNKWWKLHLMMMTIGLRQTDGTILRAGNFNLIAFVCLLLVFILMCPMTSDQWPGWIILLRFAIYIMSFI